MPTSRGAVRLVDMRRGRFREETDATFSLGAETTPAIEAKHFAGRPSARADPWIEVSLPREDERFLSEIVAAMAEPLAPGGRLMVVYGNDETERMLRRGFPSVLTPVGAVLLEAGCTWFKDWYFAEGGREGEAKLQGNLPADEDLRGAQLAHLRIQVDRWLEALPAEDDPLVARARARAGRLAGGMVRPQKPWLPRTPNAGTHR